jgi:hypothetical protein
MVWFVIEALVISVLLLFLAGRKSREPLNR